MVLAFPQPLKEDHLRKSLWHYGLGIAVAFLATGCNDATKDVQIFRATLAGSEEVPARATGGFGTAGVNINNNNTMDIVVEVHGVQNITASHIHIGARGVNGSVRLGFPLAGTPIATVDGILVKGTFGPAAVTGVSYDELVAAIRSGNAYVNVHSTTYTGGEIRGQLELVQ
jgi:CHRD domain